MKLHHESDPLFFVADPSKKEPDGCAIPHATYEPESVRRRPMAAQTCRQAAPSLRRRAVCVSPQAVDSDCAVEIFTRVQSRFEADRADAVD